MYRMLIVDVIEATLGIADAQARVDAMVELFGPHGTACTWAFDACFEPMPGHQVELTASAPLVCALLPR